MAYRAQATEKGGFDSLVASWRQQRWPMRILRAFLGGTFVFAGIQKLSDPNFLHSGTPDYIGAQLQSFALGSPIRPVLSFVEHFGVLAGVVVALVELAIGICTLAGIAPKTSAAVGLAINVTLFLSATWHVKPYFLGSDSIYAVAWGAYLAGLVEAEHRATRALQTSGTRRQRMAAARDDELSRRRFLRGALVGTASLFIGAIAFGVEGKEATAADSPIATLSPPSSSPTTRHHGTQPPAPQGTTITSLDSLPVGGSVNFQDPSGEPSVLVRLGQEKVAAYSRVCTHAGCLVDYDRQAGLLVCPCHGAEFDPAHGAQPVAGPAPIPLPNVPVSIDRSTGDVIATG